MKTKTVCIQIGNSDNKLTQQQWSQFALEIRGLLDQLEFDSDKNHVHFFGGSATFEEWQNVCCVIELTEVSVELFKQKLVEIRQRYQQDSVAYLIGETQFL